MAKQFFLGQGKLYIAPATGGGFRPLGDADKFEISISQKFDDIEESQSGNRVLAAHIPVGTTYGFKLNLLEWSKENLAQALYGAAASTVSSGAVTAEPIAIYPSALVPLAHPGVSAVVVTLDAPGAGTLDLGTHYTVNEKHGSITFKDTVSAGTATVAYSYAAHAGKIGAASRTMQDFVIRLEGINVAEGGAPVIVTIKRAAVEMSKALSFLDAKHGSLELNGMVLPFDEVDGSVSYFEILAA